MLELELGRSFLSKRESQQILQLPNGFDFPARTDTCKIGSESQRSLHLPLGTRQMTDV